MRIFVAGCGRVGTGLALALGSTEHEVVGLWNRGAAGRARAEGLLGRRVAGGDLATAPGLAIADLVFVTVADDAIREVAAKLAPVLEGGTTVAHTSGCRAAAELAPCDGVRSASMHPLCACPDPAAAGRLASALWAVEGGSLGVAVARRLVADLGGRSTIVTATAKPRYHGAAVLASNGVVALIDEAIAEAAAAGLENADAAIVDLAAGALAAARQQGTTAALTGPVARGDVETVAAHLAALSPEARELYATLSRHAVAIARARGLSAPRARRLLALLADGET